MGYRIDTLKCYARIAGVPVLVAYIGSKTFKNSIKQKITKVAPIWQRLFRSEFHRPMYSPIGRYS